MVTIDQQSFDYIIVGGGSAGCVLANRLSENTDVSVCLLEAGGSDKNPLITIPAGVVAILPTKIKNWAFPTAPQTALNNRECYQPRGKALGGSSSINAMIYIRGVKQDYDGWREQGCDGWGFDDVLPYFKKAEHREAGADDFRGQGGPLNVAPVTDPSPINQTFIQAAIGQGLSSNKDFNGAVQAGVGMFEVTQKNGERWSASRAYLDPVKQRTNLTVITKAYTEKLILEGKTAVGVQVRINRETVTLKANKEVILTAGTFGSPQILLLSGIGAKDKLRPHAIEQRHDLPGVGENLQDHPDVLLTYRSSSLDTFGVSIRGGWRFLKDAFRYWRKRRGMLTTNYAESGAFVYADAAERSPDIQIHFVRALVDDHGRNFHFGHGYACHVCVLRPKSRGRVTLNDAEPTSIPNIDPALLEDERDMQALLAGVKITQKILKAKEFDAVRGKALYSSDSEDDAELMADIRARADTVYHPVGTCKMGVDKMAVVDSNLRVHGIERLRVADASIMPTLVSGNTNAPTIMIAEKAADLIMQA